MSASIPRPFLSTSNSLSPGLASGTMEKSSKTLSRQSSELTLGSPCLTAATVPSESTTNINDVDIEKLAGATTPDTARASISVERPGESAIPEDKEQEKKERVEDEKLHDDWEFDPANPRNWRRGKKWTATAIVSFYTLISPLASSMMAPGLIDLASHYGITNTTVLSLTLSIFLLSFALGPLIWAPLSEMYGRTWPLHISNILTLAFNLGCAFSPNTGTLLAMRLMAGLSSSAPIAIGGGSISDLFAAEERASAMAIYSLGPLLGPAVGPIAGGFISQYIGIKWVFIIIAAMCGVASVISIPLLKETYAPVLRLRRAEKAGVLEEFLIKHPQFAVEHSSKVHLLWINISRPTTLLFKSFILFILSLYMAFLYGLNYLMFATFAELFKTIYGFKTGIGGLVYLGLGVGFLLAALVGARWSDQLYHHLNARNGGVPRPENRLPSMFVGSVLIPVGLFWYGWSAEAKLHWIMPIIGTAIFAFAMMVIYLPIQLYLVDSFTFAASALSAAAVFRSLFGFAFPLFASQMFQALGIGPGNSLLAGIAIVLGIPFPIWIYFRGEELRKRNKYTR